MNLNDILKQVSGRADMTYYDNASYVEQWWRWYRGKVDDFHSYKIWTGKRFVPMERFTLAMAKKACEDWANLLINEKTDITLSDEHSQQVLNGIFESCNFWRKANDGVEKCFALGGGAFVVSADLTSDENGDVIESNAAKIKVSFINAKKIRPITFEDGDITECAFIKVGNKRTTIAVHLKDADGTYKIHNIVCDGDSEDALSIREDDYYIFDTKSTLPWFYVFRPNIANNIDINSPLGISIFANAIDLLKEIDIVFDSYQNEFVLGRKRIFINARSATITRNGEEVEVFDSNDVAFYVLPEAESDDGVFIKNDTQNLRVAEHEQALQNLLNLYSYACGFGTNHYKFNGGSIATATQVVSENSDLFRSLKKHEIIIEEALRTIVKAVAYAVNTFTSESMNDSEIQIQFDDSIIEDKQGEMANDRLDVSMGVMSKAEFRAKWYNEDLETAQRKIDEMSSFTIADNDPYIDDEEGGDGNVENTEEQ